MCSVREALIGTLPEGQQTADSIETTLRSPQLRQALGALSEGLQGESYSTVLSNFGISQTAGTDQLVCCLLLSNLLSVCVACLLVCVLRDRFVLSGELTDCLIV